jgi:hypothetical protein
MNKKPNKSLRATRYQRRCLRELWGWPDLRLV